MLKFLILTSFLLALPVVEATDGGWAAIQDNKVSQQSSAEKDDETFSDFDHDQEMVSGKSQALAKSHSLLPYLPHQFFTASEYLSYSPRAPPV